MSDIVANQGIPTEAPHNRYIVRLRLGTPVILPPSQSGRLHLDALLLSIATQWHGDFHSAKADLPVSRDPESGIALCSEAGWFSQSQYPANVHFVRNIFQPGDLAIQEYTLSRYWAKSARQDYRPLPSKFQAAYIPEMVFVAETGHPDRLLSILEAAIGIGKKTTAGWGRIRRVSLHPTNCHPWQWPDGTPARALPLPMWKSRFNGPCEVAYETVREPFWSSAREVVAVRSMLPNPLAFARGALLGDLL